MKVSKFLVWLIAVLAALCFTLTPVIADEHPWSEDENPGGSGDGGEPGNGGITPEDPNVNDPETFDDLFGSSLYWWELIWDGLTGDGDTTNGVATDAGPSSDNTDETGGIEH
jgi:hypothetical protein